MTELAVLIKQIQELHPLMVSDELRVLARKAAKARGTAPNNDVSIEEWARRMAEEIVGADD